MPPSVVALAELPAEGRERMLEFLVASKVEFAYDPFGERYVASVRIIPPPASKQPAKPTPGSRQRAASAGQRQRPQQPLAAARRGPTGAIPAPLPRPVLAFGGSFEAKLRTQYPDLCGQLPALAHAPRRMPRAELTRFAEEAYVRARDLQLAAERDGRDTTLSLSRAVLSLASGRYGLPHMVALTCWSVAGSVHALRNQHRGIALFGRFLDGSYGATVLDFCLQVRSAAQQRINAEVHRSARHLLRLQADARQAIQVVRDAVPWRDLQVTVLQRLDDEMAATGACAVEVEDILVVATEEFVLINGFFEDLGDPSSPELWKGMDPELHDQAAEVTNRILTALAAQGAPSETDDARGWALRSVARGKLQQGIGVDETGDAGLGEDYVASPESLRQAWRDVRDDDLDEGQSAEELALEHCVHERLASAAAALAEELAPAECARECFVEELVRAADTMLEALVNDDYNVWRAQLGSEQEDSASYYSLLQQDYQDALAAGMSPEAVERICQGVVSAPGLAEVVMDRAVDGRGDLFSETF